MGIPALWEIVREEDRSVPFAELAENHFKAHGRPLRIAVDEADWRFNNLTVSTTDSVADLVAIFSQPQQVYLIREKSDQPAFQGIEKSMFYRICRLLTLNIQLLFVFDGPRRPWKRGRMGQGRIDYEKLRLIKEMLRYLQIPAHEAPGEAEAECARLQQLGVVDAVFSQDSDTSMFGCSFHIRDDRVAKEKGIMDRSKENTKKSGKTVRVIRGPEIAEKHHLDREGLVLFAMLCGGDYDMKGLPKCGAVIALAAVNAGLGTSLCRCRTQQDCLTWREELVSWIQTERRYRDRVPFDYPDIKTLNKYNRPTISSDEQLLDLRGLRGGWDRPIDELKLLELTSSRFNIWGKLYMNWIGPVLLTRYLVASDPSQPRENLHHIKLTKQRSKKGEGQSEILPLERKLSFSPFALTTLTKTDFEGERAGYWTNAVQDPFDPDHRVENELPTYLLDRILPLEVLDPPTAPRKAPRKRQHHGISTGDHDDMIATPRKKKATPTSRRSTSVRCDTTASSRTSLVGNFIPASNPTHALPSLVTGAVASGAEYISLLSDSDDDTARVNQLLGGSPAVLDSDDDDDLFELERAMQRTSQNPQLSRCTDFPPIEGGYGSRGATTWTDRRAVSESLLLRAGAPDRMGTRLAANVTPTGHITKTISAKSSSEKNSCFRPHGEENTRTRDAHYSHAPFLSVQSWSPNATAASNIVSHTTRVHPQNSYNISEPDLQGSEAVCQRAVTGQNSQVTPNISAGIRAARLKYFSLGGDTEFDEARTSASKIATEPSPTTKSSRTTKRASTTASFTAEIETIDLTDL